MKFWKHTFVAAVAFIGIGSTVLYTSCEKDSCLDLKCLNGGACTDGFCRCPSEYEGPVCGERIVDKFPGAYYGETRCVADTTEFPAIIDTIEVFLKDSVTLTLVQHSRISDTFYGKAGTKDTQIGVTESFITIPDDSFSTNYIRKVTVKLDEGKKRLTVYTQNINRTNPADKTDCNFLGFKK
jgi:hypothetical protein